MSKATKYRQCSLSRKHALGETRQVTWLPEKFAVQGKALKLKNEAGEWEDGWLVLGVGMDLIDEPPDIHKMIRGHRASTGDSLPKRSGD